MASGNITDLEMPEGRLGRTSDTILRNIADGVIGVDSDGNVIYLNGKAEELTGWKGNEAIHRTSSEVFHLVHALNGSALPDIFEQVMKTGERTGLANQSMLVSKQGEKRYLSANVSPVKNESGIIVGAVGVFRDVTRFKTIEEDLRKEKDNFKNSFQFAPAGMIIVNEEREILDYNQSLLGIAGKKDGSIKGLRLGEGLGCANSAGKGCGMEEACNSCILRINTEEVIRTGTPYINFFQEYELTQQSVRGKRNLKISAVPLEVSDTVNAMLVIEDMTDIKQSEKALRESELKFKALFNNVTDAIFVMKIAYVCLNCDKSRIIEVNDTASRLLGYSRDEFLAMDPEYITDNIYNADWFINTMINNGEAEMEMHLACKDGNSIDAEVKAHSMILHEEKVVMVIVRDVTEQKKAQKEIQNAIEAAQTAYKAKSQFLANMSHEIRTPLNGIIGMIDLCMLTNLTPEQKDNMITAKSCAASLLSIINNILDFSKLEAGKMVIEHIPFDLKELVKKLGKVHFYRAAGKGLNFKTSVSESIPDMLYGDPNRLEQVINNLLSNAVKFTEAGGINLTVSLQKKNTSKARVHFEIEDSGIGISEEDMKKLFKSFTQVDGSHTRKYGGTGLGLVISKQLIESMGGTLEVNSSKGAGSTFYFDLDLDIAKTVDYPGAEEKRIEDLRKLKNKAHILLVEDDKVNQVVVSRMLNMLGYTCEIAENGLEALKSIEGKSFDLCLMDIQMPEMDGITAVQEIRKKEANAGGHLPVIALTAYALPGDKERFIQAGMDEYLSKPLGISDLGAKLQQVLDIFKGEAGVEAEVKHDEGEISAKKFEFAKSCENSVRNLGIAIEHEDLASVEKYAHDIQTQAGDIGEEFLKMDALRIVLIARKKRIVELPQAYAKLTEQWKAYLDKQT